VDFDSKYGHRRDPVGYGRAIEEFDSRLPEIIGAMKSEDILILCADHGNDPIHSGWDHTREHVPVLLYGKNIKPGVNLGTRMSFADISATIAEYLNVPKSQIGESFLKIILK
jgi:phosphopentomutase